MLACEHHVFWPFTTQPSPSRAAARDPLEHLALLAITGEPLVRARHDHRRGDRPDREQPTHRLLEQNADIDHRAAGPAVLLGDDQAGRPTQLGELPVDLGAVHLLAAVGEPVALLARPAFAPREVADRVAERELLVAQRQGRGHAGL
jgi:hypothetical protein